MKDSFPLLRLDIYYKIRYPLSIEIVSIQCESDIAKTIPVFIFWEGGETCLCFKCYLLTTKLKKG